MIIKSLGKLSISGGIVSGAVLVDSVAQGVPKDIQQRIEKDATTINTVEDIELFEKIHNCKFVFVKSGGSELYGAREFLEKETKNEDAKKKVLSGIHGNMAKSGCQREKGTVTLFYGKDTKQFAMTPPPSGW